MENESHESNRNYWMFICNPRIWDIGLLISDGIKKSSWRVAKNHKSLMKTNDLAMIRVGSDTRSIKILDGRQRFERKGIHAFCVVTSDPKYEEPVNSKYDGIDGVKGSKGSYEIEYKLAITLGKNPIFLEDVEKNFPDIDKNILSAPQSSTYLMNKNDFARIIDMIGLDENEIDRFGNRPGDITWVEQSCLNLDPVLGSRLRNTVERGPEGQRVKEKNQFRCQICEKQKLNPYGFRKTNGEYYVEAHHAVEVAKLVPGTLHRSYIMTLCANHHRQLHYGVNVTVSVEDRCFVVCIDGIEYNIDRCFD